MKAVIQTELALAANTTIDKVTVTINLANGTSLLSGSLDPSSTEPPTTMRRRAINTKQKRKEMTRKMKKQAQRRARKYRQHLRRKLLTDSTTAAPK